MFVRTKTVGERRYHQLVENYREDGRHRQRVVAHLGEHDTPEDALESLRLKLDELEASDLKKRIRKAEREAGSYESSLRKYWDEAFARYHDGEIPTSAEVDRMSGDDTPAPLTDEVEYVSSFMGKTHTSYKRQRVDRTREQHEYRKAMSFGEEFEIDPEHAPNRYGRVTHFEGAYKFGQWLGSYHYFKAKAAKLRSDYERKRAKLEQRIEKLESVVTKTR
jgi:hypothetical protein